MCGIAGQLSTSNIQPNTQAVLDALAHRGPDAQAYVSSPKIRTGYNSAKTPKFPQSNEKKQIHGGSNR